MNRSGFVIQSHKRLDNYKCTHFLSSQTELIDFRYWNDSDVLSNDSEPRWVGA